jgi:nitrate/TMAO reductase-like tetraheme cytochrome c subunit
MTKTRTLLGLAAFALAASGFAVAEGPTYIGVDKCKMCHKGAHTSWQGTAHAKAIERLKPEERSKAECLKCHATGGKAEMPGVQCEACHGPGSEYKSLQVMKDKAASLAAGLILPDEQTCLGCHAKAPHDLPPFDFATMKPKGVHGPDKKPEAAAAP